MLLVQKNAQLLIDNDEKLNALNEEAMAVEMQIRSLKMKKEGLVKERRLRIQEIKKSLREEGKMDEEDTCETVDVDGKVSDDTSNEDSDTRTVDGVSIFCKADGIALDESDEGNIMSSDDSSSGSSSGSETESETEASFIWG